MKVLLGLAVAFCFAMGIFSMVNVLDFKSDPAAREVVAFSSSPALSWVMLTIAIAIGIAFAVQFFRHFFGKKAN